MEGGLGRKVGAVIFCKKGEGRLEKREEVELIGLCGFDFFVYKHSNYKVQFGLKLNEAIVSV